MKDLLKLELIDRFIIRKLLEDKTTGKNITWATDSYAYLGPGYERDKQILLEQVISSKIVEPRIQKSLEVQKERTKKNAEVFTPAWVCNKMNNQVDSFWFGEEGVFNEETDNDWMTKDEKMLFLKKTDWKKYVGQKVLEITCGEAPFLASRYDSSTGELIAVNDRIGLLDRKLRIITENTESYEDWFKWAVKALKSIYGYEFQGDSLLIGRINIFLTMIETTKEVWDIRPTSAQINEMLEVIVWNIWQMDGLTDYLPIGVPEDRYQQNSLFDFFEGFEIEEEQTSLPIKIKWWDNKQSFVLKEMKEGKYMDKRKWDVVIGNPPYQIEAPGTSTSDKPVYHLFIDEAQKVGHKVELITPGRFLFNAGATPKIWNEKMLNDNHFSVLYYNQKSSEVFPGTDIKGGVAITYYDKDKIGQPIGVFTPFPELNSIIRKVLPMLKGSIDDLLYTQNKFNLKELNEQIPGLNRKDKRLESNAFKLPVFTNERKDKSDYKILGLEKGKRIYKYCSSKMIDKEGSNLTGYKVILPKSNGSGAIGEVLSTPLVGTPLVGYTRTFIGIGNFDNEVLAENALKYIKSKFARTMLGVLKITQDNNPGKWKYVPLQDFSYNSDIDWSKSVSEIDQQLYKKYGLSPEEIEFIETHVKEMD